ncbi:MAG: hypothetical protein KF852_14965 [Saprospiraceae bacterium]|nr:hypothetical protein [Saprospiraceae bacterium]
MSRIFIFLWYVYSRYQFWMLGIGFIALLAGIGLSIYGGDKISAAHIVLFAIAGCLMAAPMLAGWPFMEHWNRQYVFAHGLETDAVVVKVHPTKIRIAGPSDEPGSPVDKYEIALLLPDGKMRQAFFYDAFYLNSFYPNERGMASTPVGTKLKIRYLPAHPDNFIILNDRHQEHDRMIADKAAEEQRKQEAEKARLIEELKKNR